MSFIDNFFCFLFKYYSFNKGKSYGLYSTILSITALICLNVLFFLGLFLFQIDDNRMILFNFPKWQKYVIPTIIILLTYLYFKNRYDSNMKKYNSYPNYYKRNISIWSLFYIIVSVSSTIFMLYSVRNNVRWW